MKLNVFKSTRQDGIMSKDKKYFKSLTTEERELLYEKTLERFFQKKNISLANVIILPEQNNKISSSVATPNKKKIKEAIVLLKESTKDLVVAVETTDYPVIVATAKTAEGKSISAIGLGTLENLNNNILHEMIESLIKETSAAPFEMTFYIGACASKDDLVVDAATLTHPMFTKKVLLTKGKQTYLDLRFAIFNELINEIVDPNYIYFDQTNPVEDENSYSTIANKLGKSLTCVVYQDEEV